MKKKNYYLRVVLPTQKAKKRLKSSKSVIKWIKKNQLTEKQIDRIIENLVCR